MNQLTKYNPNINRNITKLLNVLANASLPVRVFNTGRSIARYMQRRRRKRNNILTNGKLEVNKAVGGYKSLANNGRIQEQTIDMYVSIYANQAEYSQYSFTQSYDRNYNIQAKLNDNEEFLKLRSRCIQYKIKQVSLSFNYCRVPASKEIFSKMILTPESDQVLEVVDPKLNRNSMTWDMTQNGTKNYQFRINKRNTNEDNVEWQSADSQWSGVLIIHISEQGENRILEGEQAIDYYLGTMKVSVNVIYVQNDSTNVVKRKEIDTSQAVKLLTTLINNKMKENPDYIVNLLTKDKSLEQLLTDN